MTSENSWIVKEKPNYQELPIGGYLAVFEGVQDKQLPDGMRWRWSWRVTVGEYAGRYATALTKQEIHPASPAGILINGLLGRPLVAGENVKQAIDACIGRKYMVTYNYGPKVGRWPSVRNVMAPPAAPQQ